MKIGRIVVPPGGNDNLIVEDVELDFKEMEDVSGVMKGLVDKVTAARSTCYYASVCTDAGTEKCKECAHYPVRSHFMKKLAVVPVKKALEVK